MTSGDATFYGWTVTAGYLLIGGLCGAVALRERATTPGEWRRVAFWTGCAALLVALGLNKQADLHHLLRAQAMAALKASGWYAHRGRLLVGGMAVFTAGSVAAGAAAVLMWRHDLAQLRWVLAGLGGLGLYVLLRAESVLHTHRYLSLPPLPGACAVIVETAALICIACAAHGQMRRVTS